ncbi:MAG: hypothetical protein CMJ40_10285 [Phycisphaerae bacterium]|nr:hypothetical protein [Phycisphaerae bacterium]
MNGIPSLLVVDLDGTLLCPRGQVSQANRESLAAARRVGIEVMIATGRTHMECIGTLDAIGYTGPLVIASGAALVDWPSGMTLHSTPLQQEDTLLAASTLQSLGHSVMLLKDRHVADVDYTIIDSDRMHPTSSWWLDLHGVRCRHIDDLAQDDSIESTLRIASLGTPEEMAMAAEAIQAVLGDRVFWRHWPAVGRSGECVHMLEIFMHGVNKWTMVSQYCHGCGINVEKVAAIGDGLNDIELLAGAGVGIAVENADQSVLAVADRTTRSHDEDGVAHAIELLMDEGS